MTLFHRHHYLRERDDEGVLHLTCACGHRVEAIQRTDLERATMREKWPAVSQPKARRAVAESVIAGIQRFVTARAK